MPRVACIMMQRNENLLLQAWIVYHGQLFGLENLFIYDNGSTMPDVLETLRRYEAAGVNIDRSHTRPEDFDDKGHIVGARLHEFENTDAYDIVFPLDCDEFVAIADHDGWRCTDGFSCGRTKILAHLDTLVAARRIVGVTHCLSNLPGALDLFRLTSFTKTFVPLGDFRAIDHGYHQATAHSTTERHATDIIYIHLHYKPFADLLRHAADKLAPFVDIADAHALRHYDGVGNHLVRYFFTTPQAYAADLGGYPYPLVRYRGFTALLAALMPIEPLQHSWCAAITPPDANPIIAIENTFHAGQYLAANPDVVRSIMNPTVHYCLFGFTEHRSLRPPPPRELSAPPDISSLVMPGHPVDAEAVA